MIERIVKVIKKRGARLTKRKSGENEKMKSIKRLKGSEVIDLEYRQLEDDYLLGNIREQEFKEATHE